MSIVLKISAPCLGIVCSTFRPLLLDRRPAALLAGFFFGHFPLLILSGALLRNRYLLLCNPLDCRYNISALEYRILASLVYYAFQMFQNNLEGNLG